MNTAARTAAPPIVQARVGGPTQPSAKMRATLYVVFFAIWTALLVYGFDYYRLGLADRLRSSSHAQLKPSGEFGLLYGYIGAGILLLLLLYSVRKRVRALHRLGRLGRWLNVHIFFGIAGPAMITLHAGFRATGAIAIGYWAMIGVMLSGFVGYYLLRQVGGALSETENASELLTGELELLDRQLTERFGFTPADLAGLRARSGMGRAERMGVLTSLVYLLTQDFLGLLDALGLRGPERAAARLGPIDRRRLRKVARKYLVLERRRAFLRQTSALFHYWHAIHKPFTFVLFIMMGIHIGVAVWLGYALPRP